MQACGDIPTDFHWRAPGLLLPDTACNFVVRLHTRDAHFPEHEGYLSLKFVLGGREQYYCEGRCLAVDDEHYFVLNHGQRYASEVSQNDRIESVAVFFDAHFAADVLTTLSSPLDRMLNLPQVVEQPVHFFDRLYPKDEVISETMSHIRGRLVREDATPAWLAEQFCRLLERLLQVHRGLRPAVDSIQAVKRSTRVELYRRLGWGRDYLASGYSESVSLAGAAEAACMSPYRFLRLFTQAFGTTPHRYLTERRLCEACRLLRSTDLPVTDVCLGVGFESLGSFSTLFRSRFRLPPSQWRRSARLTV